MPLHADDLSVALRLADAADGITTARFRADDLVVDRKPDRTPVTDADTAVVDPIDGTKNFLRGVPAWATLIALVVDGLPVAGVVSAPALGRRWWASAGSGAFGSAPGSPPRRLGVSGVRELADAYLSTTDLNTWGSDRDRYLALVSACWESRAFGDYWHHCLVAEGALDLAAEPAGYPWDLAAVQILVTEAGGTFTDLSGRPGFDHGSALASNGHLHDAALAIVRRG
jgi:histidinol-phosphatase